MANIITDTFHSMVEATNSISNNTWGAFFLTVSISLGWYGKTELAYYFAGVASTLMGVKSDSRTVVTSSTNVTKTTQDNPDA